MEIAPERELRLFLIREFRQLNLHIIGHPQLIEFRFERKLNSNQSGAGCLTVGAFATLITPHTHS